MVEEAIRNGTWIPPPTRDGSINPGAKPDMFEAFLMNEKGAIVDENAGGGREYGKKEDVEWDAIMPFSATYLQPPKDARASPTPPPATPSTPLTARFRSLFSTRRLAADAPSTLLPLASVSPLTTSPASPGPNGLGGQPEALPPPVPSTLRVAVLIAMPSPVHGDGKSESGSGGDEESVPHVEFGVMDVCLSEDTAADGDAEGRKRMSEESDSER